MNDEKKALEIYLTGKFSLDDGYFRAQLFRENEQLALMDMKCWGAIDEKTTNPSIMISEAFKVWIDEGLFVKTVTEPRLLKIFEIMKKERAEKVDVSRQAWDLLPTMGSEKDKLQFVLKGEKKMAVKEIVFTGKVERKSLGDVKVFLSIGEDKKVVGKIKLKNFEAMGTNSSLVDKAFQWWVTNGLYVETIKDPELFAILEVAQKERLGQVVWYLKTWCFIFDRINSPTADGCERFILTTDKSDLPDREKRIIEIGEEAVLREESKKKEDEALAEKKKREAEEETRKQNSQFISATVKAAIKGDVIEVKDVKRLEELGLLEESTSFRSGAAFPGERTMFRYDFSEGEIKYMGFIGFDAEYHLISVDQRFPQEKQIYLREKAA
jgi:hypothetical protein